MWEGGAYTAISVWLNKMYEMFMNGEEFPQLVTVVVYGVGWKEIQLHNIYPLQRLATHYCRIMYHHYLISQDGIKDELSASDLNLSGFCLAPNHLQMAPKERT